MQGRRSARNKQARSQKVPVHPACGSRHQSPTSSPIEAIDATTASYLYLLAHSTPHLVFLPSSFSHYHHHLTHEDVVHQLDPSDDTAPATPVGSAPACNIRRRADRVHATKVERPSYSKISCTALTTGFSLLGLARLTLAPRARAPLGYGHITRFMPSSNATANYHSQSQSQSQSQSRPRSPPPPPSSRSLASRLDPAPTASGHFASSSRAFRSAASAIRPSSSSGPSGSYRSHYDDRSVSSSAAQSQPRKRTHAEPASHGSDAHEHQHKKMRRHPRRPAKNGRGGGGKPPPPPLQQLEPPLLNREEILRRFPVTLKQQWEENPKAPLANYLGGGSGGAQNLGEGGKGFVVTEGSVNGQKVFRPNKKEAEKLAALSAVLQLQANGLAGGSGASAAVANAPGGGETATLSDGSELTYDRARNFMEWYCNKFKFGKPDVEYMSAVQRIPGRKKGGPTTWEAVMSVSGRHIGQGSGQNKKGALIRCYLDVTKYLESCDPGLWAEFVEYAKRDPLNLGMAPHLVFSMSDALCDEVQGLCGDIRHSLLYYNAPPPDAAAHVQQTMPAWSAGRRFHASASELQAKSMALQDRLADYETDPKLEKMRDTRAALPVHTKATDILARIEVNDVTIVMAATGSGKTTQVPQLILDDWINRGDGAKCNIVCTQPRRLAAMSVAERVADERGQPLGREVGYQVRFDVKVPQPDGSITFCTTGIFLKRMQSALGSNANPESVAAMDQVTHVVVDEVHERDVDTDLLLVVLKRLLADRKARRKPIKIVLMSATIDPTLFQRYFADERGLAPVAEVPGRTFPVERHYLDEFLGQLQNIPRNQGGWVFDDKKTIEYLDKELSRDPANFVKTSGITSNELEIPYPLMALTIAHVLRQSDDGHVLVFLPGWDEIKKVADILLDNSGKYPLLGLNFNDASEFSVHYLHSTIPAAEQREVFKPPPPGVRRIILATNIAETSVTIPDVVYVVDSARVKEKRYDPDRHMSSLVSAWVGSSNLGQRAGRAGRHREGEYFGLLSRRRLESLDPHQLVEMKRSDLSNVVMHVKALNLGEVEDVLAQTIEPPEPPRVMAAMDTLRMLGALDGDQNLTSLGRVLLQLPVDAAIGKLCLFGSFFRCLDSALTLAAVLTNRDPFIAPLLVKQEADAVKDSWSPVAFRSDPFAVVAAFNQWSLMDDRGEFGAANRFASDNFLSKPTLLQIKQVKGSLLQSLEQAGIISVSAGGHVPRIGRRTEVPPQLRQHDHSLPLLAALIAMASAPNFAIRTSEKACRTSQDKMVWIHSSSVNSRRREVGGPEEPSASFNPAEKRLYAFGEKTRNVPPGGNPNNALTQIRSVTRLDPLTYMLFGAYELQVASRGLEADGWLPITGNLHALDDLQRLKTLFDTCMLRVFEGVGKALTKGRDERFNARNAVDVRNGSSRIRDREDLDEENENESDDEDSDIDGPNRNASSQIKFQAELARRNARKVEPLSQDEIRELGMLTTDIVRILDAYAAEREGGSTYNSRPNSRPVTPGMGRGGPMGGHMGGAMGSHASMGGMSGPGSGAMTPSGLRPTTPSNPNVYRPPQARRW
ncbi:DEAH RNA helicase [Trichosporon asahii var. asahii CBS 8904]|uniref:DEAH RNA helicase n=1 Tax=Trichosporon asahii var. asahii (strain CBS 8904) TaxID=1220162 RepID=K1V475_TRIAC|nr:DEAH RNA helicase [Trichosporon asahii var. asahii CBS 8904]